jgi:hypothetical protein
MSNFFLLLHIDFFAAVLDQKQIEKSAVHVNGIGKKFQNSCNIHSEKSYDKNSVFFTNYLIFLKINNIVTKITDLNGVVVS